MLEKLFKALFVKKFGGIPLRTHDLARLAKKCDLDVDQATLDQLDLISRFNLSVRYPDQRQEIYKTCTKEFSLEVLKSIKETRSWLLKLITTP